MSKILLATICNRNDTISEQAGIASIASVLRESGHTVKLTVVKEGYNDSDFIQLAYSNEYDFIGFNVYYHGVEFLKEIICKIKAICKNVKIVVGGYVATYYDEELFEVCPEIDYIIRGEGELVFSQLVSSNDPSLVKGISFQSDGKLTRTPACDFISDLDALPFIARDVMEEFQFTTAIMSTSRGCTRNCSFCSSPDFWRQRKVCWRGRSPENIADEIELIVEKYNIHNFDFIDASFEDPDKNCSRLLSISNEFIKRQLKIVYTASIRVDSVLVLEKYFNILRESGLRNIFLGIESGNEDDLSLYNKRVTLQSAEKAINLLKKYNFNVEIGFINFNPYSTFEKLRSNIQFLHKYGYTSYLINTKRLRVYKGCGIAEKILRDNLLAPDTGKFIYDYKFKDPRVGELYLAISQFIQFDYRNYNFFTKYQNYSIYFFEYTEGLRETFPNSVDVITDCEEDVRKKLSIFSEINYSWFVKMIDLGENGSSATEMMDYTLKHLYSKEAISTLSAIEEIERKLKKLEGSLRACKP